MTFVSKSDLIHSVDQGKMSNGVYIDGVTELGNPTQTQRKTIQVAKMLEFRAANLKVAGNPIISEEKGLSRYHVITRPTAGIADDPSINFFHKVRHYEGPQMGPFSQQDNQFWENHFNPPQPIVQRPQQRPARRGWAACPIGDEDRNFLPLSRSTSSESCAIPR